MDRKERRRQERDVRLEIIGDVIVTGPNRTTKRLLKQHTFRKPSSRHRRLPHSNTCAIIHKSKEEETEV